MLFVCDPFLTSESIMHAPSSTTVTRRSIPPVSHLHACRSCTLDPDSLDPLAQLASLRDLSLHQCTGVTAAALERLLSTSVQGCCLNISVSGYNPDAAQKACARLHSRVLAKRGSRDTPALSVQY
jgi:hypothetical protein